MTIKALLKLSLPLMVSRGLNRFVTLAIALCLFFISPEDGANIYLIMSVVIPINFFLISIILGMQNSICVYFEEHKERHLKILFLKGLIFITILSNSFLVICIFTAKYIFFSAPEEIVKYFQIFATSIPLISLNAYFGSYFQSIRKAELSARIKILEILAQIIAIVILCISSNSFNYIEIIIYSNIFSNLVPLIMYFILLKKHGFEIKYLISKTVRTNKIFNSSIIFSFNILSYKFFFTAVTLLITNYCYEQYKTYTIMILIVSCIEIPIIGIISAGNIITSQLISKNNYKNIYLFLIKNLVITAAMSILISLIAIAGFILTYHYYEIEIANIIYTNIYSIVICSLGYNLLTNITFHQNVLFDMKFNFFICLICLLLLLCIIWYLLNFHYYNNMIGDIFYAIGYIMISITIFMFYREKYLIRDLMNKPAI